MTSTFSYLEASKPKLLGSMHKYADGYGYGKRVETSRNIAGERKTQMFDTTTNAKEEGKYVGQSKPFRLDAVAAEQRCQLNRNFLASGEYGKFHFESNVDNIPESSNQTTRGMNDTARSTSRTAIDSARSTTRSITDSARNDIYTKRSEPSPARGYGLGLSGGKGTLGSSMDSRPSKTMTVGNVTFNPSSIDPVFGRSALRDLAAVERPPTSRHEKLFHISASQQSYDLSASFARALRPRK